MFGGISIRNAKGGEVATFGAPKQQPLDLSNLQVLEGDELKKDLERRNGGLVSTREQDRAQLDQIKQGILAGVISDEQASALMRRNPGAQLELAVALKQAKQPRDPSDLFGKIDPKNYTQESVRRFAETQDFASLVPRDDPNQANARNDRLFTQAGKLRDEFRNLSKNYMEVRDAYGRIQESAKNPSAAGDLALIFNYMKMLDPGSTVREGEFATAQNSAGIPDRVRAMYNKTIAGERLAPSTRNDFTTRAGSLYKRQLTTHQKNTAQYSALAKRYGVDPQNVTTDFTMDEMPAPAAQVAPQAAPSSRVRRYNPATGKFE
jgi:hypothetical protein